MALLHVAVTKQQWWSYNRQVSEFPVSWTRSHLSCYIHSLLCQCHWMVHFNTLFPTVDSVGYLVCSQCSRVTPLNCGLQFTWQLALWTHGWRSMRMVVRLAGTSVDGRTFNKSSASLTHKPVRLKRQRAGMLCEVECERQRAGMLREVECERQRAGMPCEVKCERQRAGMLCVEPTWIGLQQFMCPGHHLIHQLPHHVHFLECTKTAAGLTVLLCKDLPPPNRRWKSVKFRALHGNN